MKRWKILFTEGWTYDRVQGTGTSCVLEEWNVVYCYNLLEQDIAEATGKNCEDKVLFCFGYFLFFFPPVLAIQVLTQLSTDRQYKSGNEKGTRFTTDKFSFFRKLKLHSWSRMTGYFLHIPACQASQSNWTAKTSFCGFFPTSWRSIDCLSGSTYECMKAAESIFALVLNRWRSFL